MKVFSTTLPQALLVVSSQARMSSIEQDGQLPIANVGRIMKQILPPNAKISKEAKETMQECVSEFISFVTGEASDKCHKEKRKTVNGDDVCCALATLGFDNYAEQLKRYLHRYREQEWERVSQNRAIEGSDSSLGTRPFWKGQYYNKVHIQKLEFYIKRSMFLWRLFSESSNISFRILEGFLKSLFAGDLFKV